MYQKSEGQFWGSVVKLTSRKIQIFIFSSVKETSKNVVLYVFVGKQDFRKFDFKGSVKINRYMLFGLSYVKKAKIY